MSNVVINDQHLKDIASAIRYKNGTSNTYRPVEMAPAINALVAGGSGGGEDTPFTYEIVDWATGTDLQIQRMVEAADRGLINLKDYWHVGDERPYIHKDWSQSGEERYITYHLVLMDCQQQNLDRYQLMTPTPSGRTTGSFIIGFKEALRAIDDDTGENEQAMFGHYPQPGVDLNPKNPDGTPADWPGMAYTPAYISYTSKSVWWWRGSNVLRFFEYPFHENLPPWLQAIVKRVMVLTYEASGTGWAGMPSRWFLPSAWEVVEGSGGTYDEDNNLTSGFESFWYAPYEYYASDPTHAQKTNGPGGVLMETWATRSAAEYRDFYAGSGMLIQTASVYDYEVNLTDVVLSSETAGNVMRKAAIVPHAVI